MKIKVLDLRKASEILFSHLEETHRGTIELDIDYYWNIPGEKLYEINETPDDLDIGQLSDDWEELQTMVSEKNDPIGYRLIRLSAILRAIGEKTVW